MKGQTKCSLRLRGGSDGGGGQKKKATSGVQLLSAAENKYKMAVAGPSKTDPTIWSCLFAAVAFFAGGTAQDRAMRRDEKLEDAAETFLQASNKLKLERKWKQAGDALLRSGDCYQRHSEMGYEAANKYADAAKLFRKENPEEAVSALERAAVALEHAPDANMQHAARIHRDLAELHEVRGRYQAASDAMERAVELFEADGASIAAESLEVKVADLAVLGGDLLGASRRYEDFGSRALRSDLKSCGGREAQDHWFRAALCLLATGSLSQLEEAMERFGEQDLTFPGSRKAEVLRSLQEALVAADEDAFTKQDALLTEESGRQIRELGDTLLADKTGVVLMTKVREVVSREGVAGAKVAGAVAQQDDDDLL